jgi:hypothetical protein
MRSIFTLHYLYFSFIGVFGFSFIQSYGYIGEVRTYIQFCQQVFVLKSTVLWDVTSCSPLKVNRRFGRIYRLHLQGRISRARTQRERFFCLPPAFTLVSGSAYYSTLKMRRYVSPKRRLTFNGLHDVISRMGVLLTFI